MMKRMYGIYCAKADVVISPNMSRSTSAERHSFRAQLISISFPVRYRYGPWHPAVEGANPIAASAIFTRNDAGPKLTFGLILRHSRQQFHDVSLGLAESAAPTASSSSFPEKGFRSCDVSYPRCCRAVGSSLAVMTRRECRCAPRTAANERRSRKAPACARG